MYKIGMLAAALVGGCTSMADVAPGGADTGEDPGHHNPPPGGNPPGPGSTSHGGDEIELSYGLQGASSISMMVFIVDGDGTVFDRWVHTQHDAFWETESDDFVAGKIPEPTGNWWGKFNARAITESGDLVWAATRTEPCGVAWHGDLQMEGVTQHITLGDNVDHEQGEDPCAAGADAYFGPRGAEMAPKVP